MGFEPTASSMRPKRSSQLSYTPAGRIRVVGGGRAGRYRFGAVATRGLRSAVHVTTLRRRSGDRPRVTTRIGLKAQRQRPETRHGRGGPRQHPKRPAEPVGATSSGPSAERGAAGRRMPRRREAPSVWRCSSSALCNRRPRPADDLINLTSGSVGSRQLLGNWDLSTRRRARPRPWRPPATSSTRTCRPTTPTRRGGLGENVTVASVTRASTRPTPTFLGSRDHRANMLATARYNYVGAAATTRPRHLWVVEEFMQL